jgi:peptide deformylase
MAMKHLFFFVFTLLITITAKSQSHTQKTTTFRQHYLKEFEKSPDAPLKGKDLDNIRFYQPDSTYRVTAKVQVLTGEKPFQMPTYDGTSKEFIRYALLTLTVKGQPIQLTIYRNSGLMLNPLYRDYLFLPFTDLTNGEDTYMGGRYIDLKTSDIKNNTVEIDFNKAYNPYCAYSDGYRCPVPPRENDLQVAIKAGEKKYTGSKQQRPKAKTTTFTEEERKRILSGDTSALMRVVQITKPEELKILKSVSTDIQPGDVHTALLARRMYASVMDTARPGVGIAAPQVGINRNAIWVKRFDKEGEPFEFYLNPKITWRSKLIRKGKEGCLSIPDIRDDVYRNYTIRLQYQDLDGKENEEMIEGFTAVIFQHETDHLLGILFTDRLQEQANETYFQINNETDLYLKKLLKRQ